jgi:hypothetical protein
MIEKCKNCKCGHVAQVELSIISINIARRLMRSADGGA